MQVSIYLKGGQTITLTHIKEITTRRAADGELSQFAWETEDLPHKKEKLHHVLLTDISAISTSDR